MTVALPLASLAVAAAGGAEHDVGALLLALAALFIGTQLLGELAQRIGQPAVLGELLAGVLLGGSVLGIVDPGEPVIAALGQLGVLVLLFTIGLETDVRALARVGSSALAVGVAGVLLPFAGGFVAAQALGLTGIPALVAASALTATSIGISARVLGDLGRLETPEGRVVLGAAVLDDIIGLVILSIVAGVVGGVSVTTMAVARTAGVAIGFVVLALALGGVLAPPLFRMIERLQTGGTLGPVALAFAFLLAWLAHRAGSAMIIGAFAAGLVLHPTPQRQRIEKAVTGLGHFFVPIFFATVGAAVDLRALASPMALALGAVLVIIGVVGKVIAGFVPWWFPGDRLLIGVAMVPRGEVGLIFAQMGLASGAIGAEVFGALMMMVLVTTFVTPPLLGRVSRRSLRLAHVARVAHEGAPGDGGIDDLVAGTLDRKRDVGAESGGDEPVAEWEEK